MAILRLYVCLLTDLQIDYENPILYRSITVASVLLAARRKRGKKGR
jgi:hypothetical protein